MKVADIYNSQVEEKDLTRFWNYVDKTESCWNWQRFTRNGYGAFNIKGVIVYVHKLSWCVHNGPVPSGLCVLHTCDNRKCVNPDHLFLGTIADNNRDKELKGRGVYPYGSWSGMSKLNEEQVMNIKSRLEKESLSSIAREYGVSVHAIYCIKHNITWKHVGGDVSA